MKWRMNGKLTKMLEKIVDLIVVLGSLFFGFVFAKIIDGSSFLDSSSVFWMSFSSPQFLLSVFFFIFLFFFIGFLTNSSIVNKSLFGTIISFYFDIIITSVFSIVMVAIFQKEFVLCLLFCSLIEFILIGLEKAVLFKLIIIKNKSNVMIYGSEKDFSLYFGKFVNYLPNNKKIKYIVFDSDDNIEKAINLLYNVELVYILPSVKDERKIKLLDFCSAETYVDTCLIPQVYDVGITNATLDTIDDTLVYRISPLFINKESEIIKRFFDVFLSLIGIIVSSPIFLFVFIMMKLFDKGPVIYKQERMTKNRKVFTLYKFRTMKVNCENESGAIWSVKDDKRITKIGKILRKFRLDELPQLINVIKGDMSFVGPRPERPILIEKFEEEYPEFKYRLNVKAGITGYAQVYGKYNTRPIDKLRFDLFYIRNYSLILDIKLIVLTVKTIFDKDSTRGVSEEACFEDLLGYVKDVNVIR